MPGPVTGHGVDIAEEWCREITREGTNDHSPTHRHAGMFLLTEMDKHSWSTLKFIAAMQHSILAVQQETRPDKRPTVARRSVLQLPMATAIQPAAPLFSISPGPQYLVPSLFTIVLHPCHRLNLACPIRQSLLMYIFVLVGAAVAARPGRSMAAKSTNYPTARASAAVRLLNRPLIGASGRSRRPSMDKPQ